MKVKRLTKVNCAKYGIEVAPQFDFTDDGNRFRGFIYKGMPMTQCYADGECFLTIRIDYLKNNFTWNEWRQTEEYQLEDEFNGVEEFEMEKLIENLEKIITKVDEMNTTACVDPEDLQKAQEAILNEVEKIEAFCERAKKIQWWTLEGYTLSQMADYTQRLFEKANYGRKVVQQLPMYDIGAQKSWIETVQRKDILSCHWYMEMLEKHMN